MLYKNMMEFRSCYVTLYVNSVLLAFLLLFSPVFSLNEFREEDGTSTTGYESKKINRPFVKSIQSPDGDIIDCVLFNLQPAFDNPELKEYMTLIPELESPKEDDTEEAPEIEQLWNSMGETCPNGTIPIKRPSADDDILRSISDYKLGSLNASTEHEVAIGFVQMGPYYGAKALLNLWKPLVAQSELSVSQVWVSSTDSGGIENSVEAGWQVSRLGLNNGIPRFFIYWKGHRSGCFNMLCPGFIQTSQKVSFGTAFKPISIYNGKQYELKITIWKQQTAGVWWLKVADEIVGFWPTKLFNTLQNRAYAIKYGGEVYYHKSDIHTKTQMGSGHFPFEGYKKAAFARNLQVVDENNDLKDVENLNIYSSEANCYSATREYDNTYKHHIYYGGPGYNPECLK